MRTAPLILAGVLSLALSGCVPSAHGSASPVSSATPVFASDAEALKAAEAAYAAYLKVSDEIAHDGGKDPGRINRVAVGNLLSDDLTGFGSFLAKEWHSVGRTRLTKVELQSATLDGNDMKEAVSVYLCEDVSHVSVVDSSGDSVVSEDRPDKQQFQVTFDVVKSELIPSEREPWTGSNICA